MVSGILSGMGQQFGALSTAQAAGMRNAIQPAQPTSPMAGHAERLHKLAEELQQLNSRLMCAIDRMTGPIPETTGNSKDCPEPGQGSLLVAQFGAERVNIGIERLAELVTRLEGIV